MYETIIEVGMYLEIAQGKLCPFQNQVFVAD